MPQMGSNQNTKNVMCDLFYIQRFQHLRYPGPTLLDVHINHYTRDRFPQFLSFLFVLFFLFFFINLTPRPGRPKTLFLIL